MRHKITETPLSVYVTDSGLGMIIHPKPSPATLWRWRKAGWFPQPIKLPGNHNINRTQDVINCFESRAEGERKFNLKVRPGAKPATVFTMPLSEIKNRDSSVGMSA